MIILWIWIIIDD